MKKLAVIFTFILSLSAATANASVEEMFDTLWPDRNELDYKIAEARHEATLMMQRYIDGNPGQNTQLVQSMIRYLKKSIITKRNSRPATRTSHQNMCDESRTLIMYVPTEPVFLPIIRLCRKTLSDSINKLSQSFIHEAYHLAEHSEGFSASDIMAEVYAVEIEMTIMQNLIGCSFYDSDYFRDPVISQELRRRGVRPLPLCR